MNPVDIFMAYFSEIHPHIMLPFPPDLPSDPFLSGFPSIISYEVFVFIQRVKEFQEDHRTDGKTNV
jgi:hypothetical protein